MGIHTREIRIRMFACFYIRMLACLHFWKKKGPLGKVYPESCVASLVCEHIKASRVARHGHPRPVIVCYMFSHRCLASIQLGSGCLGLFELGIARWMMNAVQICTQDRDR